MLQASFTEMQRMFIRMQLIGILIKSETNYFCQTSKLWITRFWFSIKHKQPLLNSLQNVTCLPSGM